MKLWRRAALARPSNLRAFFQDSLRGTPSACLPPVDRFAMVQGGADRLAATTHPKPLAHQPSQTSQGPAWLGIGAGYERSSRLLLSIAYGLAKGGLELWAKATVLSVKRRFAFS
jgi:hypothetical protein